MSPSDMDLPGHGRATGAPRETAQQSRGHTPASNLNTSAPAGTRSRSDDSWIEVSSQPSSSSLSSANDEIITTGLRVQHDSNLNRQRRRQQHRATGRLRLDDLGHRGSSAGTSSQEEYEESESESDQVLSSSNEALPPHRSGRKQYAMSDHAASDAEDDEDENSTAVGYNRASTEQSFAPQPNAFTHSGSAPVYRNTPTQQQTSYFERPRARRASSQRHSYPSQQSHTPYNIISPSHQADHDAALRASLSTLLSCAAAARGLPKSQSSRAAPAPTPSSRVDPSTLRMVPESALPSSSSPSPPVPRATTAKTSSLRTTTNAATKTQSRSSSADKHKRRHSRDRRGSTKKARRTLSSTSIASLDDSTATTLSPTLLTWVVSAGVVVLVSALSFSAGYVVGRDAGRAEVEMLGELGGNAGGIGGGCGSEALGRGGVAGSGLGLRRLRLADAVRVS
ncbi:hypothetical protein BC567DRAFT_205315 [Phyllosticta citribraziliensis]